MEGYNFKLVELLKEHGMSISTAESCTGGLIASEISAVPGASEVFFESIVTYSNEAKMRELGVRAETLAEHGAVSRETAEEMSRGICAHTGANIGIGVTGIAGPSGGTVKKPVGTVFVSIYADGGTNTYHLMINGSRTQVREEACNFALKTTAELLEDRKKT